MWQKPRLDWWLLTSIFGLLVFGLLMVWSATQYVPPPRPQGGEAVEGLAVSVAGSRALRQAAWAALALTLMMLLKQLDYRRLNHPAFALGGMAVAMCLLGVVYLADRGNHRFLRLGLLGLQPSELAKPALVIFLAHFIAQHGRRLNEARTLIAPAVILTAVVAAVTAADLGTGVVLAVTAAVMLWLAGLEWRYFGLGGLVALVLLALAVWLFPYRLVRIIAFVDPQLKIVTALGLREPVEKQLAKSRAARDADYQQRQALVALGSGGWRGLGLMQGEHKFGFLPEAHNDFIYAVVGEETGLIGCAGVLAAFVVILLRGLRLANRALEDFGRYLALGVTTMVVFQALLNMSVVLKLLPTKGISLPMVSYGGSSLVATMILFGMLLSVSDRSI